MVAALRSTWMIMAMFFFLEIEYILLASGYMLGNGSLLVAGNSLGFVVAFCACKSAFSPSVFLLGIIDRVGTNFCYSLGRLLRILGQGHHALHPSRLPHREGGLN